MSPQPQPSKPGAAALAIALGLLGHKELPGQPNQGPICHWSIRLMTNRLEPVPWCCGFVLTCYHYAGVDVRNLGRTLECEVLWRIAATRGWGWTEHSPQVLLPGPGDIVLYANGTGRVFHCGLVKQLDLPEHDLATVEGNSRNMVRIVHRPASSPEIFGYVRIPDALQTKPPPFVSPTSAITVDSK